MEKKSLNIKKLIIITAIILLVVAVLIRVWFFWLKDIVTLPDGDPVLVQPVAEITGYSSSTEHFAAVVEPQDTVEIKKDDTKTIDEIFVSEGQEVVSGDRLFSYKTDEMSLSLTQAQIDLESLQNRIATLNSQLQTLRSQLSSADESEKPAYTLQVQSTELEVKTEEYNVTLKNAEIANIQQSISNAVVMAEVSGTVQSISQNGGTDSSGVPLPFMTIVLTGDLKVKGVVTELNRGDIYTGETVRVISRINPSDVWTGTIEKIDTEAADNSNSQNNLYFNYAYATDSTQSSTKYNFYVTLDSSDGLILGQHVYIEPDNGISVPNRPGLWLPSYYIVLDEEELSALESVSEPSELSGDDTSSESSDDTSSESSDDTQSESSVVEKTSGSYVWIRGEDGRIKKSYVKLGEYDADWDTYEILSGLTKEDYIAYPSEEIVERLLAYTAEEFANISSSSDGENNSESSAEDSENMYDIYSSESDDKTALAR